MSITIAQALVLFIFMFLLLSSYFFIPQGDVTKKKKQTDVYTSDVNKQFQYTIKTINQFCSECKHPWDNLTHFGWKFLKLLMALIHLRFVFLASSLAIFISFRSITQQQVQQQPVAQGLLQKSHCNSFSLVLLLFFKPAQSSIETQGV